MDESANRELAETASGTSVRARARIVTRRAWQGKSQLQNRAQQAKLAAHQRVEPFWPATAISVLVTLSFYIWTLQMIGVQHAMMIGCMAIGSSLIQEMGHWLAMARSGYRAHFLFLPWLVWLLPKEPQKYEQASRWHKSLVAVTGPFFNVSLMVLGGLVALSPSKSTLLNWTDTVEVYLALLHQSLPFLELLHLEQLVRSGILLSPDWHSLAWKLISVNAGIATMSLLPIPFLDGGKLLKNLLESVGVVHDRLIAAIVGAVVFGIALALFLLGHIHPYPVAAILGTGWLFKKHHHDAHFQPQAMTVGQTWTIFVVWLSLFSISLSAFLIVPATIQPENTHRAIEILSNLWRSLS